MEILFEHMLVCKIILLVCCLVAASMVALWFSIFISMMWDFAEGAIKKLTGLIKSIRDHHRRS